VPPAPISVGVISVVNVAVFHQTAGVTRKQFPQDWFTRQIHPVVELGEYVGSIWIESAPMDNRYFLRIDEIPIPLKLQSRAGEIPKSNIESPQARYPYSFEEIRNRVEPALIPA